MIEEVVPMSAVPSSGPVSSRFLRVDCDGVDDFDELTREVFPQSIAYLICSGDSERISAFLSPQLFRGSSFVCAPMDAPTDVQIVGVSEPLPGLRFLECVGSAVLPARAADIANSLITACVQRDLPKELFFPSNGGDRVSTQYICVAGEMHPMSLVTCMRFDAGNQRFVVLQKDDHGNVEGLLVHDMIGERPTDLRSLFLPSMWTRFPIDLKHRPINLSCARPLGASTNFIATLEHGRYRMLTVYRDGDTPRAVWGRVIEDRRRPLPLPTAGVCFWQQDLEDGRTLLEIEQINRVVAYESTMQYFLSP